MNGGGMAKAKRATLGVIVRSTLQMSVFVVSLMLWAVLAVLAAPVPYRQRYWLITRWTHFNLWWLEVTCGVRCEVRGIENIPRDRAGIVLAKHQSTWETMALQRWFNPETWVLKRELIRLPFFGWAMAMLRPIAIDRSARTEAMKQLCDQGADRLRSGIWVVVFPEGTRMAPGERGRYRPGGAVLAERTGAPVIPVAHNAGEYWGRNRFLKFPGKIQVRIGAPLDTAGKSAAEIMKMAEEWIEGQMREIAGGR